MCLFWLHFLSLFWYYVSSFLQITWLPKINNIGVPNVKGHKLTQTHIHSALCTHRARHMVFSEFGFNFIFFISHKLKEIEYTLLYICLLIGVRAC